MDFLLFLSIQNKYSNKCNTYFNFFREEFQRGSKQRSSRRFPKVQKPLIFFIHGVGGSADKWRGQIDYFNGDLGYECVAPDLIGHGFSSAPDRPKSYTFTKLLRDIVTIFDHFTRYAANVVGHDKL